MFYSFQVQMIFHACMKNTNRIRTNFLGLNSGDQNIVVSESIGTCYKGFLKIVERGFNAHITSSNNFTVDCRNVICAICYHTKVTHNKSNRSNWSIIRILVIGFRYFKIQNTYERIPNQIRIRILVSSLYP